MRLRPRSRMQMQSGNDLHRWTVSFADFMTLMFAVFVVLYAASVNDKEQYEEVIQSIQNASKLLNRSVLSSNNEGILTHNSNHLIEDAGSALLSDAAVLQVPDTPSQEASDSAPQQAPDTSSQEEVDTASQQATDELSEVAALQSGGDLSQIKLALEQLFVSELDNESIELDLNGDWLTVEMGGDILFSAESHTLLNSANKVVGKIARILAPVNNLLRIRGYSDNDRVANEIYLSNWELSGMRAFSVLHALNAQGITGERMVVEAYGRYSPVLDENNRVDLLKSRRVVIAVSKYAVVTVEKVSKLTEDKDIQESNPVQPTLPKEDSKEMQEVYLPNNRLIITTRQE